MSESNTHNNDEYPIVVEGISKTYKLAHRDDGLKRPDHESIRDAMVRVAKKPLRLADSHYGRTRDVFYALNDVSFKVPKGQVLAVMGKNGSGKSTLFKIIARVTSPSSGEARITGRVGSLLEVGAGFHPELTGRENTYFNGSILGMKKSEIEEKFDSILEFAEMDRFIDTPVKFYSSGMKTRLAFSIAVHLNCDVLLLDEVLAVGDYAFRMKCFAKMEELAKSGKTILFVSHLPAHIRRICTHGILLKDGELIFQGNVEDTIAEYLENIQEDKSADEDAGDEPVAEAVKETPAEKVEITDAKTTVDIVDDKPSLSLDVSLKNISKDTVEGIRMRADLLDKNLNRLAVVSNTMKPDQSLGLAPGKATVVRYHIPNVNLAEGAYTFNLKAQEHRGEKMMFHELKEAAGFSIPKYRLPGFNQEKISQTHGPVIFDFDCSIKNKGQ